MNGAIQIHYMQIIHYKIIIILLYTNKCIRAFFTVVIPKDTECYFKEKSRFPVRMKNLPTVYKYMMT